LKTLYYSNKSTNTDCFNENSKEHVLTHDSYRVGGNIPMNKDNRKYTHFWTV